MTELVASIPDWSTEDNCQVSSEITSGTPAAVPKIFSSLSPSSLAPLSNAKRSARRKSSDRNSSNDSNGPTIWN